MKNSTVKRPRRAWVSVLAGALILMLGPDFTSAQNGAAARAGLTWRVVVNNGVTVPGDTRRFNSYNEPSLNVYGLVVFRARSKGGTSGEPAHGVFTRDMAVEGAISTIFDRNTLVPEPNNVGTLFAERRRSRASTCGRTRWPPAGIMLRPGPTCCRISRRPAPGPTASTRDRSRP